MIRNNYIFTFKYRFFICYNNIDENLFQKPILNAGVYSIPKSNEIWDMWKNEYGKIIENSSNDYCLNMDQASLNKVIYDNLDQVNF